MLVPQRLPVPGQELGKALGWMLRQARQHVSQPGARVNLIELAGFDQRVQRRRQMPAHIRAGKGPVPAPDCNLLVILPMSGRK